MGGLQSVFVVHPKILGGEGDILFDGFFKELVLRELEH
jgi:hypothetical protein